MLISDRYSQTPNLSPSPSLGGVCGTRDGGGGGGVLGSQKGNQFQELRNQEPGSGSRLISIGGNVGGHLSFE